MNIHTNRVPLSSRVVRLPRAFPILAAVAAALLAASPAAGAPTDALQREQWAVAPDTLLDLPGAWALSEGAGVVVAVVDSGMRLDHPDLAPNAWTNFAEVPGNGVDDDANGYVDDVHGVDLTNARTSQDLHDGHGHGTHVSGTIAAAANGRGVVGVAFRAKLMTVKVLDDQGAGTTGAVAEGIRYAAANGARIINLSLETTFDDSRMRAAIEAAAAANVLVDLRGRQQRPQRRPIGRSTPSRSPRRTWSAWPRPSRRQAAPSPTSPTTAG